jgi:hypothetical protein
MKLAVFVVAALCLGACSAVVPAPDARLIPGQAVGPLEIGMTREAVGELVGRPRIAEGDALHYGRFTVVLKDEVVNTILLTREGSGPRRWAWLADLKTKEGVGLGSSLAEVEQVLGPPARRTAVGTNSSLPYPELGLQVQGDETETVFVVIVHPALAVPAAMAAMQ